MHGIFVFLGDLQNGHRPGSIIVRAGIYLATPKTQVVEMGANDDVLVFEFRITSFEPRHHVGRWYAISKTI